MIPQLSAGCGTAGRRRRGSTLLAAVVSVLVGSIVLSACSPSDLRGPQAAASSPGPTPTSATTSSTTPAPAPAPNTPEPTAGTPDTQVRIREVPSKQWAAMKKAGMVRAECPVTRRSDLRRVEVPYTDFNGDTRRGYLVVHRDTAASAGRILQRLYALEFPIRRMVGVEKYDGDLNRSLRADNTSAYNCRRANQINAPFKASPHANGRAVDINPRENPWRDLRCDCWSPSSTNAKRSPGKGKVLKGDPVWKTFDREGWIWQNISVADYMHFDTGYPSRPPRKR